jgi:hypothetical protein
MKNLLNLSLNEAFEDVKKMRNLYLNRKENIMPDESELENS